MRRDCQHITCTLPNCDCPIDYEGLDHVGEVVIPSVGNLDEPRIKEIQDMAAKGEKKTIVQVAIPEESLLDRIYGTKKFKNTRVGNLINKALRSRRLGRVVDVLGLFIPQVGVIDRLTTPVKNILFKPKQDKTMNESTFEKIKRFLKQESTRRGLSLVVGLVGSLFGYEINPDDLLATATTIVSGAALLYAAWKNIKDIFIDEDKA